MIFVFDCLVFTFVIVYILRWFLFTLSWKIYIAKSWWFSPWTKDLTYRTISFGKLFSWRTQQPIPFAIVFLRLHMTWFEHTLTELTHLLPVIFRNGQLIKNVLKSYFLSFLTIKTKLCLFQQFYNIFLNLLVLVSHKRSLDVVTLLHLVEFAGESKWKKKYYWI